MLEGALKIASIIDGEDQDKYSEDVDEILENLKSDIVEINIELGLGEFDGIDEVYSKF
jgi:hypothetical protein